MCVRVRVRVHVFIPRHIYSFGNVLSSLETFRLLLLCELCVCVCFLTVTILLFYVTLTLCVRANRSSNILKERKKGKWDDGGKGDVKN